LTGSNVSLEVFDFIVKHKFKLLKFLGLLLERVDFLFTSANVSVLVLNLLNSNGNTLFEYFCLSVLLFDLMIFVLDLTLELINVRLNVCELVVGELELSLGFKGHISDLRLVVFVFVVDVFNFKCSVLSDLLDNFFVLFDDLEDFTLFLVNLTLLNLNVLAVSFCFSSHFLCVVAA